jgi:hypothetical protein
MKRSKYLIIVLLLLTGCNRNYQSMNDDNTSTIDIEAVKEMKNERFGFLNDSDVISETFESISPKTNSSELPENKITISDGSSESMHVFNLSPDSSHEADLDEIILKPDLETAISEGACDSEQDLISDSPYEDEESDEITDKPILSEYPIINDSFRHDVAMIGSYKVDYVYVTDGTKTTPQTLIKEGDDFLNWRAEDIWALCIQYEDGSITYTEIVAVFKGEVEIKARLEYTFNEATGFSGVYAFVNKESYSLLPLNFNRRKDEIVVEFYESDEVDGLIKDCFGGTYGIIDECKIVIQDYTLISAHTEGVNLTPTQAPRYAWANRVAEAKEEMK